MATPPPPAPDIAAGHVHPPLDGDHLPDNLIDAADTAYELVWAADALALFLRLGAGPKPRTVAAADVGHTVARLDTAYRSSAGRLTPVLNDLCRFGGPYSAGDLHARCAHAAALEYAGRVRRRLDLIARTVPGGPRAGPAGGLLTADQVRAVWDEVVRLSASQVQRLVGDLPFGDAIRAALAGELLRTAAGRAAEGGGHRPGAGVADPLPGRSGTPKAEAEVLVRGWLAKHARADPRAVTVKAVAAGTGVSTGGVGKTAAWQAFQAERVRRRAGPVTGPEKRDPSPRIDRCPHAAGTGPRGPGGV